MCKKLVLQAGLICLLLGACCGLVSANTSWTGQADDNFWMSPDNWDNGVPDLETDAIIDGQPDGQLPAHLVEIDAEAAAESNVLRMAGEADATLEITGGTYLMGGGGEIGLGHAAIINMSGGEVTQSGYLQFGRISEAQLNISGGKYYAEHTFRLGGYEGGVGILNVTGGEFLKVGAETLQSGAGEAFINISGGICDISGELQLGYSSSADAYYEVNLEGGTFITRDAANLGMATNGNQYGEVNIYDGAQWIAHGNLQPGFRGDTVMNMHGGTVWVGGDFTVAYGSHCVNRWATGQLNMYGGQITVENTFYAGMWEGHPEVYLEGGTVECNYLDIRNRPGAVTVFDITGGTLIINGDRRDLIDGYVSAGLLTGYGSDRAVSIEYADGKTIVTADVELLRKAGTPSPANYATAVSSDVSLDWEPGEDVQSFSGHILYFGPEYSDVDESADPYAILDAPGFELTDLQLGQTYYWRVDQVDAGQTYTGDVWQFTVADYVIVDNFEQYDTYMINNYWIDGLSDWQNGSTVYVTSSARTGQQAMRIDYSHTGSTAGSEVTLSSGDMDCGSNWTQKGVKGLTLYFRGAADNTAEAMYVLVSDQSNEAMIEFGDAEATALTGWTEWNIAFADIEAQGVNLSSISSLTIGISQEASGQGTILVDDIRLYVPRCVPAEGPLGDFTGDCFVDYYDLRLLTSDWLESGEFITGAPYDADGLLAYYTFEQTDSLGWYVYDSSGNDHTAEVFGPQIVYDQQRDSNVAKFEIVEDFIIVLDSEDESDFDLTDAVTVAMWIKPDSNDQWARAFMKSASYGFMIASDNAVIWYCAGSGAGGWGDVPGGRVEDGQWHHIAGVFDITSEPARMELYVDGVLVAADVPTSGIDSTSSPVILGQQTATGGAGTQFLGLMDEVMVFDYALSEAEIAGLVAGQGQDLYQPLDNPELDIYEDGKIDFMDFSVLADQWLTEQLWPEGL